MKTELKIKDEETRQSYLIRVAIEMLKRNAYKMDSIIYDEAECDALCLAEDLEIGIEEGLFDVANETGLTPKMMIELLKECYNYLNAKGGLTKNELIEINNKLKSIKNEKNFQHNK